MKSFALVRLLAFLWGSSYPLLKVAVETIPPLTVVAIRSLLGGLILLCVLGRRAHLLWAMRSGSDLRAMLVQSAFNCIIPWILIAWAVRSIDAGLATILNSLSPIFIFLITALVTRHEPVTGRKFAGVLLGIGGVVAIVGLDALSGVGTKTLAEIACVAGAISYAIAGVIGVRFAKVTPLVPAAGTTLIAAMVLVPLAVFVEQPWTGQPSVRSLLCTGRLGRVFDGTRDADLLPAAGDRGVDRDVEPGVLAGLRRRRAGDGLPGRKTFDECLHRPRPRRRRSRGDDDAGKKTALKRMKERQLFREVVLTVPRLGV